MIDRWNIPMPSQFIPIHRDTLYLLPPAIQDWLPENHLARFVVEVVDQLDLGMIEQRYGGGGKAAYHPALLVGLLFYGYATGVFSSRKLEQATHDSVAFRFIAADTHPDHDTIATFRKRFLKELDGLFVQILLLAQSMGLLKLGKVSLDGTKIKANASKHKALSWQHAQALEEQLKAEVAQLLAKAEETDKSEADTLDIPEELKRREARLAAIAEAKAELERRAQARFEAEQAAYEEKVREREEKARQSGQKPRGKAPKPPEAGPRDKDQVNLTDEESRIMPSTQGFVQAYNAQAAVDTDSYLIVENHLTQQTNDQQEVEPALEALAKLEMMLGDPIEALLGDAGYYSKDNVQRCEDKAITPYLSNHREKHNRPLLERQQEPAPCADDADAVTRMNHRLQTKVGKAVYALRKSTVEPVFGIIKQVMGFRQFHLRGKDAAASEWNLVSMAWNLKRMHRMVLVKG
jgi:transposase